MDSTYKFKIFLVDDDMFSLTLTEQNLKNMGYTDISIYENGTDCLGNLVLNPDIVFLDHNMDGLSGFEVLKKIKRYNPNIYVVMLSAQENIKTAVDALKYGAFDYIIKGDEENEKMISVIHRIAEIQILLNKSKPSLIKKILTFYNKK